MRRGSGNKVDRKTAEKNRRNQMKHLCLNLVSLIPPHHLNAPKESLSQPDQIEQAAHYIQKLSARVEELRRKKVAQASGIVGNGGERKRKNPPNTSAALGLLPVLRVRDLGSCLEVVFITELRKNFMLHQVIQVLEEEGAEVDTANICRTGDKMFHTLHAKVKVARVGVDTSRISVRLQELIC